MQNLQRLFEPLAIGRMELKNRIKMPALALGYDHDGEVTERLKGFYLERAKGGVALIGISCTATPPVEGEGLLNIYNDRFIGGLRELVEICHAQGAKAYVQVAVGYTWAFGDGPIEFVSPSGLTARGRPGVAMKLGLPRDLGMPRALTVEEIHQIVEDCGEAARRTREAGFDAFEVIAATGYILSQFLSPVTNKRTDEYGGSLENRMRMLLEIVDLVKKKAGDDYPLMFRLSGSDFLEGGYSIEDTKLMAGMLEKAGAHSFDVLPGWHDAPVPMVQMSVSPGAFIYLAEEVKQAVSVPVAGGNCLKSPLLAEQALAEGKVDLVYLARPLIADPELPNKAREGRLEDIRPCIACCTCFDTGPASGGAACCAVNARAGKEGVYVIKLAERPKKVLIAGGGPAGLEAARVLAQRGHRCTIFEGADKLGGQLRLAGTAPYKGVVNEFTDYLVTQVKKEKVELRLGEEVSPRTIEELKPEVVVIATGARPSIPQIPGIERAVTAWDVLEDKVEVGDRVLVLGGGIVGCEVAEFLVARNKQVVILEMLEHIGIALGQATRWTVMQRLRKAGVRMEVRVKVVEVIADGARVTRDGKEEFFEGDSVVVALGSQPNGELAEQLRDRVPELYVIGDCAEPRKIVNAIEDAVRVACEI